VWSVIPDVQNPVVGQLGHYYNGDRNLYFYDGYNWHNVYALAHGVASLLATADRPATANEGTIYYDTTEHNLKIFYGGEWVSILKYIKLLGRDTSVTEEGTLKYIDREVWIYLKGSWQLIRASATYTESRNTIQATGSSGQIAILTTKNYFLGYSSGAWRKIPMLEEPYQIINFTNSSGETIDAKDGEKITVTNSFGAVSILDFTDIRKEEGKTIEINILSGSIIRVKDGATEIDLNGCNESIVKAICLSDVWHFYKTSSITEIV
jgi:hypothetical protein